jgi:extracellular elastinolytic metalloproteinase
MKKRKLVTAVCSTLLAGQVLLTSGIHADEVKGPVTAEGIQEDHESHLYDVRNVVNTVLPNQNQLDAANKLIQSIGSGTNIKWNNLFGTPSTVIKEKGYLTAPSNESAETIARNWLKENAALYGLQPSDIDSFVVSKNFEMPGTGLRPVTLQQTFDGIESVYGGRVIIAVNKDGQILSAAGNLSRKTGLIADFQLSEGDALKKAVDLELPGVSFVSKLLRTENGWAVFDGGEVLPAEQRVKKATFITEDGVRPAFRVLFIKELNEGFEMVIDAANGKLLYQRSLVDYLLETEGLIFENYPGATAGGKQVAKSFKGDPKASPKGWLIPGTSLGLTTFGNNANSYANWSNFLVPADQAVRPLALDGDFSFIFKNAWQKTNGQTTPPSYAEDLNSAATNLFYHHNLFHDYF